MLESAYKCNCKVPVARKMPQQKSPWAAVNVHLEPSKPWGTAPNVEKLDPGHGTTWNAHLMTSASPS